MVSETVTFFPLRIYIIPINDAPEITVIESDAISYEPGTGPVPITDEFEGIDVDSEFLQLAEIGLIDSSYSPSNDELIFEDTDHHKGRLRCCERSPITIGICYAGRVYHGNKVHKI